MYGDAPSLQLEMRAYDALPPPLRGALARAPYPPSAWQIAGLFGRLRAGLRHRGVPPHLIDDIAIQAIVGELPNAEDLNLRAFAEGYERVFRVPYPHTAAGASLIRG